jgi:Transcriptional regulators
LSQPLYQKIVTDLKQQITDGKFALHAQLPTEKELSEMYQVSRITSKRALTELEQADLIYRVRGKGSFVKEPTRPTKLAKRILFLLPFVNDLSLGNFNDGLTPVMQEKKIDVFMTSADLLNNRSADELIQEFDGMIYYTNTDDQHIELLFELYLKQFPVVLLDKKIHDFDFPAVLSDNLEGGRLATQALLEAGHTRIGYLFGETQPPQSTRQRYFGYLSCLKQHNVAFHTALEDQQANIDNLLAYCQQQQLTAIVCENDLVAIHAMRELRAANITVPQEISVIGFDNIQAAALVDPPLTTISQDFKKIGQLASETLITWIETGEKPTDIAVPVTLIQRASTQTNEKE